MYSKNVPHVSIGKTQSKTEEDFKLISSLIFGFLGIQYDVCENFNIHLWPQVVFLGIFAVDDDESEMRNKYFQVVWWKYLWN